MQSQSVLFSGCSCKNFTFIYILDEGGGLVQWLASQTMDQGVPVSRPGRVAVRCGLEQVTFTPCLVLVKRWKPWMYDFLGQTVTRLETMLCLMC